MGTMDLVVNFRKHTLAITGWLDVCVTSSFNIMLGIIAAGREEGGGGKGSWGPNNQGGGKSWPTNLWERESENVKYGGKLYEKFPTTNEGGSNNDKKCQSHRKFSNDPLWQFMFPSDCSQTWCLVCSCDFQPFNVHIIYFHFTVNMKAYMTQDVHKIYTTL